MYDHAEHHDPSRPFKKNKVKQPSTSNGTLCHTGFGCLVPRVEKHTEVQAGEEHSCNHNPFLPDGMGHKRAHKPARETETEEQGLLS